MVFLKKIVLVLRVICVLFIIYMALVIYIEMRKENLLLQAEQEVEIKRTSDTIFVIGYEYGAARAAKFADSLSKENITNSLKLIEPIYNPELYLNKRYGIFYPQFYLKNFDR